MAKGRCVIIQMDHCPNWVAPPASGSGFTESETLVQNMRARDKFLNLELSDASTLPFLKEQAPRRTNQSADTRITLILSQMIEHWFDPSLDPTGSVLPTVSVHFGPFGFLEDLDDSGFDVRRQQPTPSMFFDEWLSLRKRQCLDGHGTEVRIWQQEDAQADERVHMRLLEYYRRMAGDKPIILIQNAYAIVWSNSCRLLATKLNIILIMVGTGMNTLCQLAYADFFLAAKAAEHRERQRICQEKLQSTSRPIVFNHYDYHRLILVQHRAMVGMNDATNAVLLGSVRTGLLARRPKLKTVEFPVSHQSTFKTVEIPVVKSSQLCPFAPDTLLLINDFFLIVETEAETCKTHGQVHWSMDNAKTIVRNVHSLATCTLSLHNRLDPFQQPHSTNRLVNELDRVPFSHGNYGIPFTDSHNVLEHIVTTQAYFGSFLERREMEMRTLSRLRHVSLVRTRLATAKAKAGICACRCDNNEHSPTCPTIYVNLYRMCASHPQEDHSNFKLKLQDPQSEVIAGRKRVSSDQSFDDVLIKVPGAHAFGQPVYSVRQVSGNSLFTKCDLPQLGDLDQRNRIFSILKDLGATPTSFFVELQANNFCIDYALSALEKQKGMLEQSSDISGSPLPLKALESSFELPRLPEGSVEKAANDLQQHVNALRRARRSKLTY